MIPFEFLLSSLNVSEANKTLKSNESTNSFENAEYEIFPSKVSFLCNEFPFNADKKLLKRFKIPLNLILYGHYWLVNKSMGTF